MYHKNCRHTVVVGLCVAVWCVAEVVHATSTPHPLEVYVRAASGNRDEPITEDDVVKAYAVEATAKQRPYMKRMMAPNLMSWFQHQLDAYPILTNEPEQIHLAITEFEGNVSVVWTTANTSTASQICYYPQANASHQTCVDGAVWTYSPISIVPWIGSMHGGYMTGLTPAQSYCYRVGDPVLGVFSSTTCFLAPQIHKDSISVVLGGDMGSVQLFGYLVAEQMRRDEIRGNLTFDAFWLLGDIAYSTLDPGPQSPNLEAFWDIYMRQEESLVNHVPFMVTYGNHDFDAGDSAAFINRFRMPRDGNQRFYWSYVHGPVKFVSICTEWALVPEQCNLAPGSTQALWLEHELATVNRSQTPWLIVSGHRPMYSSDEATDSGPLQQWVEPLLRKYNVDLEMAGHMHETELVAPVFNNTPYLQGVVQTAPNSWRYVNPQAPVHFTAGNLGAIIDESYPNPEYRWSMFHSGSLFSPPYGYVRMEANRTTLHFRCLAQPNSTLVWELVMEKDVTD